MDGIARTNSGMQDGISKAESVINKIMNIDREADRKLNEAYARQKEAAEEVEEQKHMMRRQLESQAKKHLEKFESQRKFEFEESVKELKLRTEQSKTKLERLFNENHAGWEEEIFGGIVGGLYV